MAVTLHQSLRSPKAHLESVSLPSAVCSDAQVISHTQLKELLKGKPPAVQDEIVDINTDARHIALQVALIVPLLAAVIGFLNGFRMRRLPDPKPSEAAEMALV